MKKPLLSIFCVLFFLTIQAQKGKYNGVSSDRVRIIERDTIEEIDKKTYQSKGSAKGIEYLHSVGFSSSYQFDNITLYKDFCFNGSYQSRVTLLNSNDFLTFGFGLTQGIGLSIGNNNFNGGISFNYQALLGPELSLGLDASSENNDDFGFSISPIAGFFYHSNSPDKICFGPGGLMSIRYESWWDNPITLGFFYVNDIASSHGGHILGFRSAYVLGNY